MKTIAFSSIKGGTGKSSCSIMLANYLAKAGKRVLCIDMDIQNSMTFYLTNDPNLVEVYTIAEALHKGSLLDNIIPTLDENIDLVPSSFNLVNLRAVSILILERLINQLGSEYDYCIIDTAPTWDNLTLNALNAADLIVTPVNLTQWDWKGAVFFQGQINQDLGEKHLSKWKLLINGWKPLRSENPDLLLNQLQALFDEEFDNIIPVKIPESSLVKKHIDTGEKITKAKEKVRLFTSIEVLSEELTGEYLDVEAF